VVQKGDIGGFSGSIFTDTGGAIVFNLYTNPQEDVSIGIRHIPLAVPLGETGGWYLKELIKYPPQFKFVSNKPPVYDVVPEVKEGVKAWIKEHGFGRFTP
jgi:arylsulfatase